jgi:hypothetical protein
MVFDGEKVHDNIIKDIHVLSTPEYEKVVSRSHLASARTVERILVIAYLRVYVIHRRPVNVVIVA